MGNPGFSVHKAGGKEEETEERHILMGLECQVNGFQLPSVSDMSP